MVDVQCSPFHRDIFLSLGSDQEIRVHSLLSPGAPSYVVHREESGISSVCWSPVRPVVFSAATLDGSLLVYDLRLVAIGASSSSSASPSNPGQTGGGTSEPVRVLPASENFRPRTAAARGAKVPGLTSVAFASSAQSSSSSGALVAAGDSLGRAHVWKLDSEVAAARPSEIRLLDKFLTIEAEEE